MSVTGILGTLSHCHCNSDVLEMWYAVSILTLI